MNEIMEAAVMPDDAAAAATTSSRSRDVDPGMVITEDERRWALEIKQYVEDSEDLENLCDMDFAQYAIIAKGDLRDALRRIEQMQAFRETYRLHRSVEEGMECLENMTLLHPGFLLSVDVDPGRQESVNALDFGVFYPARALDVAPSPLGVDNWRTTICGIYYMKVTSQPSLAVVRNGLLGLADYGDFDWQNFSMEVQERFFNQILSIYPLRWNNLMAYNTSHVANIMFSMCKSFMAPDMRFAVQLGCQIVESDQSRNPALRLKHFYQQPTPEISQQRLLERARFLLSLRFENEKNFQL